MAEVSGYISEHVNVIDVFLDVNSILYTVTNIHPKAGISLKLIDVFHSENFALFTVTNIHKKYKKETPKQDGKVTEDSRPYKSQTVQKRN